MNIPTWLWAILFISMAIVGIKADDEQKRNTVPSHNNATQSSLGNGQVKNKSSYNNEIVVNNENKNSWKYRGRGNGGGEGGAGGGRGGGGGGGGYGWGWGGGGGGGGGGWGGGGGGSNKWGCGGHPKSGKGRGIGGRGSNKHHISEKRWFNEGDYKLGEFAQCMRKGRCKGMRLDCPLHCGGPCFYDCQYMCKAHCRRL